MLAGEVRPKRRIVIIACATLSAACGAYFTFAAAAAQMGKAKSAKAQTKGQQVSITGQISCTFCKLAHPDMACKPDCCAACIKAGDPPLLTDAEGNMYILLTGEKEISLMTPEKMKMVGGQVTVKGLMVKGKGIQAIYVDSMEKVQAKTAQ